MEEISLRFGHITKQIFEHLGNTNLTKCRKISNAWQKIIDSNQKDIAIRKIQMRTNCSIELVKNILRKEKTEDLIELCESTRAYQKYTLSKCKYLHNPIKI